MRKTVNMLIVVLFIVMVFTGVAFAKNVQPWVGSISQMQDYLASGLEAANFEVWALSHGYVGASEFNKPQPPTQGIVNQQRGSQDFGTIDFQNATDHVNVRYAVDFSPMSIGIAIVVQGVPVPLVENMTIDTIKYKVQNIMNTCFSYGPAYSEYFATLVAYDLQAFVDPATGALIASAPLPN